MEQRFPPGIYWIWSCANVIFDKIQLIIYGECRRIIWNWINIFSSLLCLLQSSGHKNLATTALKNMLPPKTWSFITRVSGSTWNEILLSQLLAGNDGLHFCLDGGWKEAMEEEGRGVFLLNPSSCPRYMCREKEIWPASFPFPWIILLETPALRHLLCQ